MTPEEEMAVRHILEESWKEIVAAGAEVDGYLRQVCARLERESELRPRFVEARPKPPQSVIRKVNERHAGPGQLYEVVNDLIGARVVVYNLSDAAVFKEVILNDTACPLVDLTSEDIDYPTGYRAVHLNGRIGNYGAEVQVRTAVQDAWAVTARADVYRSTSERPLVSSLSAAQAAVLHGVDQVLQEIRNLSDKSRVEAVAAEGISGTEDQAQPPPTSEGLDDTRLRQAREALSADDRLVLEGRVSESRVAELKAGIESQREGSIIRHLLRAVGRYERRREYEADTRFGNRMLAWKGPLVEGSNWAQFHPGDFSRGLESFLQKQFGQALEDKLSAEPVLVSWQEISNFVAKAKDAIQEAGGHPDLVVVQGNVQDDLRIEMFSNSVWSPNPQIRNVVFPEGHALDEAIEGLPTLWIYEDLRPALHVIDLTALGYLQTNPDAMSDGDLYLHIQEINWESAVELLDANPDHTVSLYKASHSGQEGSFTREEAVYHLQLQVKLSVIEAGRIEYAGEPSFVRSVALRPQDVQ